MKTARASACPDQTGPAHTSCRTHDGVQVALSACSATWLAKQPSRQLSQPPANCKIGGSRVLAPAVLLPDLGLLLGREVVHDVELLADLLRVLALDHRSHLGAREVQQALDVKVVRGKDELEEHLLLDVDVLRI